MGVNNVDSRILAKDSIIRSYENEIKGLKGRLEEKDKIIQAN